MLPRAPMMLVLIVLAAGIALLLLYAGGPPRPSASRPETPRPAAARREVPPPPAPIRAGEDCGLRRWAAAAQSNAQSLTSRVWAPMGRTEVGWIAYAPLIGREIATACPPTTPGFADALARWQSGRNVPATGVLDPASLEAMRLIWHGRRPFVEATRHGACPPPPQTAALGMATPQEGYAGKPVQLRIGALEAWRSMVAEARRTNPAIAADPRALTIFSAYRPPEEEAARCAAGGCGTPARANCSAHRTGMAVDLYVGAAPGFSPASTDDANRIFQSASPAYRWLVANAARFGFVPYAFEPWHWEWTGEPV